MSNQKVKSKSIITPEGRLSFPHVFDKHSGFEGQAEKFSATILFPKKTDLSAMKKAVNEAVVAKWGPEKSKWPSNLRMPFRDGDKPNQNGTIVDGYAGNIYVRATSNSQPGVIDRAKQEILNPDDLYAGCYIRAQLSVFAYSKAGNSGVSFGLQNIQKLRDGEQFSGKQKAEAVFDVVSDESDNLENYGNTDDDDFLN